MDAIGQRLVTKLAAILEAQEGWDYQSSQPVERLALANYLRWVSDVPRDRHVDAEPMLTDGGNVRLEWERYGTDYSVEIGPELLWMSVLQDRFEDCAFAEVKFSAHVLDRFFRFGVLPEEGE